MLKSVEIAVVGAGPQALTLVTHLLQKKKSMRGRFLVFDPAGKWMKNWHQQFAALKIPHLRSPAVHHPDPHSHALRTFAESRQNELYPPYDLPGTTLFQAFCNQVINCWNLERTVYPATVETILPIHQKQKSNFQLHLSTGESVIAKRVVLALGIGSPNIPQWVQKISSPYPAHSLCHSSEVDLRKLNLVGETLLIVGGGLTSGHLAVGATQLGATVILMARGEFQEKIFDVDPGWLGPKYLKGFWAESDWQKRDRAIREARNGGSMTPEMMRKLRQLHNQGKVILYPECEVQQASWQEENWQVLCQDKNHFKVDRIWLATGNQTNIEQYSLLSEIRTTYPISTINGLPILDQHLRWQGCELFVMGASAGLRLGPIAQNLAGARMASHYIVPALTKNSLAS